MSDAEHRSASRRSPRAPLRVLVALLAAACGPSGAPSQRASSPSPAAPLDPCALASERRMYEEAAETCQRAWARAPERVAAERASSALRALRAVERLRAWCERLAGRVEETHCWRAWAWLHLADAPQIARAGYERALALARAHDDPIELYESNYGLYWLASRSGDYRAQIQHLAGALSKAGQLPRRKEADALVAAATILQDLDDWPRAKEALRRAAEIYGDTSREIEWRVSDCNQQLGEADYALARRACDGVRRLPAARHEQQGVALRSALLNLVSIGIAQGRLDDAARRLEECRALPGGAGGASFAVHAVRLANARGRHAEAVQMATRALAAGGHALWLSILEYEQGVALGRLGRRREAAAAFEGAARRAERVLNEAGLADLGLQLSSLRDPLEELFALQAEAGDVAGAVDTFERSRHVAFVEQFVRASGGPGAVGVATDAATLLAEGGQRLQVLRAVLEVSAGAAGRRQRPRALLPTLGGRHVLAYFRAGRRVFLLRFANGARAPVLTALAPPAEELERQARALANAPGVQSVAEALGAALLPAGSLPAAGEALYVVADDRLALERLPWAALRIGGRYLVADHPLALAPSLHALGAAPAAAALAPALVAGDPGGDLPEAAQEAREVGARLRQTPFIGPEATTSRVTGAPRAVVLHLATHTRRGAGGDELVLADGNLGVEQILRARLAPRLTVLATCASGVAQRAALTSSLAQAFLAAGSPAVLASLWSVKDADTRRLAREFYDAGGAERPLAALARVQARSARAGLPVESWSSLALFVTGS